MGLPLPKTTLTAVLSQILAFIFGIICFIPGQNGLLEGAYLLSLNTSMYGHDALQTSNMFYLNNSNPLFAVMTSLHPDFEHYEPPPAMTSLNGAIMKRLEINMSDPKTVERMYDTPLRDVIKGGKEMIVGQEGQWNIANGLADFINGMAIQISGKIPSQPDAGGAPLAATPDTPGKRANLGQVQAGGPHVPDQAPVPIPAPVPTQAPISSPMTPQTPNLNATGLGTPGNNSTIQCPKICIPAAPPKPKGDGQSFGPPKPKPIIPPAGMWTSGPFTPIENAINEQGAIISAGIQHGAIKSMNAQTDSFRKAVPIYDFYNIYNTGVCWGFYSPTGPQTVGCGSSAEWQDIDVAPRIQMMVNKLVSPNAKIVGPIGLGPNMEKFLATTRILLLLMYINKVMTVVNQGFAMLIPILGLGAMLAKILPPRLHLKLSFMNFATSAAASAAVFGGTMSLLGMMMGMGLTMPPMNAMMSIEMRLGLPYVLLCLVDSVFAIVGTVCFWKIWRMNVNGAKEQANEEMGRFEREHGKIEVINVQPNKEYDVSWVKG